MADLAPPISLDPEAILSIPNRLALARHFGDRATVDTVIIKSQGEDAPIFDQLTIGSVWHDVIRENLVAAQSAPEPERATPVVVANLHTGRFKLMTLDQAEGYIDSL